MRLVAGHLINIPPWGRSDHHGDRTSRASAPSRNSARQPRDPRRLAALLLGLDAGLLSVIHDQYRLIPAALLAGLTGDVLSRFSDRWPGLWSIRVLAAGTPAALYALYFLTLAVTGGIWWSMHLWTGAVVLAGLVGLGVAVLATPSDEASR